MSYKTCQYFDCNYFNIIYLPFYITIPLTITLCARLCLNSVKNEPFYINDNELCIDLPYDKSESCEIKRIISSWIYDYENEDKNYLV